MVFFLITDESGERWRGQSLGGSGGMIPQKILKSCCSETPFLEFWEDKFCPKCSLNQLSFLCLFLLAWLCVEVVDFILYFVRFLKLFWISLSAKYTDSVCLAPHGSCVNRWGLHEVNRTPASCYFSWRRCWLVFSYHGELGCFQVSKYIKYSAYTGCIYIVW